MGQSPSDSCLIMLTRLASSSRSSAFKASYPSSSRSGASSSSLNSQPAPSAYGSTRGFCKDSNDTSGSTFNSSSDDFLSQVVTKLDENVTEQYWPEKPPPIPPTPPKAPSPKGHNTYLQPIRQKKFSQETWEGIRVYPGEEEELIETPPSPPPNRTSAPFDPFQGRKQPMSYQFRSSFANLSDSTQAASDGSSADFQQYEQQYHQYESPRYSLRDHEQEIRRNQERLRRQLEEYENEIKSKSRTEVHPHRVEQRQAPRSAAQGSNQASKSAAQGSNQASKSAAQGFHQASKPAAQGPHQASKSAAQGSHQASKPAAQGPHQAPRSAAQGSHQASKPAAQDPHQASKSAAQGPRQAPKSAVQGPHQAPKPAAQGPRQTSKRADESRPKLRRNPHDTSPTDKFIVPKDSIRDPRLLLSKPHTSHLTPKSIYFRQSIINAENKEAYLKEVADFKESPNYDPFILAVSQLAYGSSHDGQDLQHARLPHIETCVSIFTNELQNSCEILERTKSPKDVPFNGEKLDLAINLSTSNEYKALRPLLESLVQFLSLGGGFSPPVLPSTWRRIWSHLAHTITNQGFLPSTTLHRDSELAVALWMQIYLHPYDMVGHLRPRGSPSLGELNYLPANPAQPNRPFLLGIELNSVQITEDEPPLLRAPQTVSAMLAILSTIGGHQALKRANIDLYERLLADPTSLPARRLLMISALLLSWNETKAGMAGLNLLVANPSFIDPKSAQLELDALQYLMVSNCPEQLLSYTRVMLSVAGHIPSPLAIAPVLWAARTADKPEELMTWWNSAVQIWKSLPPQTTHSGKSQRSIVRPQVESSVHLLDYVAEKMTLEDLSKVTNDFFEVFGIMPMGSRTRIIAKQAAEGNVSSAIETLGQVKPDTLPGSTSAPSSTHHMSSRILKATLEAGKFDDNIVNLIQSSVEGTVGSYNVGKLVDFYMNLLPGVETSAAAEPLLPLLKWICAWPMVEYNATTGSAQVPLSEPFASFPHAAAMNSILKASRERSKDGATLADQISLSARTASRLAEIAGFLGDPAIVTNIIKRINVQHQIHNRGGTMPFSLIWFRALIRSHALSSHTDVVFQLLASLKENLLPSERIDAWKLAFKSYATARNIEAAIQLLLNVRNKTLDPEVPTWSGAYTMSIQMLISNNEHQRAVQVYLLMTDDQFELRDLQTVKTLIEYLEKPAEVLTHDGINSESADNSLTPEMHEATLHRLKLLEPTLDDTRPNRAAAPLANLKRRQAKVKKLVDKTYLADLDRSLGLYKAREYTL